MKKSILSAAIAGAALSAGGLALAPVGGAAHAQSPSGVCFKLIGAGHHYSVVAYPCVLRGLDYATPRHAATEPRCV